MADPGPTERVLPNLALHPTRRPRSLRSLGRARVNTRLVSQKAGIMSDKRFGQCCKDLRDAMEQPNSLLRIEENGVLYLTVGYVMTERGPGWFDQAILYCPFCGTALQTAAEIRARAGTPAS